LQRKGKSSSETSNGSSKTTVSSSPFEVYISKTTLEHQDQQQIPSPSKNKGLLYQTLERVANNQYLSCASVENVDDSTNSGPFFYHTSPPKNPSRSSNSKYNILQCGINRLNSEDFELDYDIHGKDHHDILLDDNNSKSTSPGSPRRSPKELIIARATKRGSFFRLSP